jgi:hypothetical protein
MRQAKMAKMADDGTLNTGTTPPLTLEIIFVKIFTWDLNQNPNRPQSFWQTRNLE